MPVVGIRELARQVSRLITEVEENGEPAVITRHGRAVAMIVPVNATALEDFVLANASEFVDGMHAANAELAAGRTRSLADFRTELEHENANGTETPPAAATSR